MVFWKKLEKISLKKREKKSRLKGEQKNKKNHNAPEGRRRRRRLGLYTLSLCLSKHSTAQRAKPHTEHQLRVQTRFALSLPGQGCENPGHDELHSHRSFFFPCKLREVVFVARVIIIVGFFRWGLHFCVRSLTRGGVFNHLFLICLDLWAPPLVTGDLNTRSYNDPSETATSKHYFPVKSGFWVGFVNIGEKTCSKRSYINTMTSLQAYGLNSVVNLSNHAVLIWGD